MPLLPKTVDDDVSTELTNIKEDINNIADNFDIILPTEVEKISRSLKLNKACGYYSISNEHLKYAIRIRTQICLIIINIKLFTK